MKRAFYLLILIFAHLTSCGQNGPEFDIIHIESSELITPKLYAPNMVKEKYSSEAYNIKLFGEFDEIAKNLEYFATVHLNRKIAHSTNNQIVKFKSFIFSSCKYAVFQDSAIISEIDFKNDRTLLKTEHYTFSNRTTTEEFASIFKKSALNPDFGIMPYPKELLKVDEGDKINWFRTESSLNGKKSYISFVFVNNQLSKAKFGLIYE